MTRLAVAEVPGLEADDREVARDGLTYTAETLTSFPDSEELFLILGADAAAGLVTWHRADEVLARVRVVVAPRPGTDMSVVAGVVPGAHALDMAMLEVSGTDIRHLAASGQPYRFLVTEPVHHYIETHSLYAHAVGGDMVESPSQPEEPS